MSLHRLSVHSYNLCVMNKELVFKTRGSGEPVSLT